jgi:ABC-2 type transport system permease protein
MMSNQLALIRREIWEHRAIYIVPAVIALLLTLMTITGQIQVTMHDKIVNLTIVFLSNVSDQERALVFDVLLGLMAIIFTFSMWVVTVFYCLDALYAERKDKSILFWRSLPITDAETVGSKLLTALLVIPAITILMVFITDVIVLLALSAWVAIQGGDAGHLIWSSVSLIDSWVASAIFVLAVPLWLSPFIGWFLFVSGFAKRMPLLLAFLPIFVLPMLEAMTSKTTMFWDALFVRTVTPPLFDGGGIVEMLQRGEIRQAAESIDLMGAINLGKFVSSPSLWTGMVVCGLFVSAAIYVRRFRDES